MIPMYFFGKFDFVEESAVENLILSRNPLFLSTDFLCKQAIHLLVFLNLLYGGRKRTSL